jgi:HEAT repeat protein
MRDPRTVDLLIEVILAEPGSGAGFHAALLLRKLGDPRAVDLLGEALRDPRPLRRVAALKALGGLQDPRAIDPIAVYVKENEADVFSEAVDTLRRMGDEAIVALRMRVEGEDPADNLPVIRVLAALGDAWGIDELLTLIGDRSRDDDARSAAAISLRQLVGKGAAGPLGEVRGQVLECLESFRREESPLRILIYEFNHTLDEQVLVQTGDALARIGAKTVEPLLEAVGDTEMLKRYRLVAPMSDEEAGLLILELTAKRQNRLSASLSR